LKYLQWVSWGNKVFKINFRKVKYRKVGWSGSFLTFLFNNFWMQAYFGLFLHGNWCISRAAIEVKQEHNYIVCHWKLHFSIFVLEGPLHPRNEVRLSGPLYQMFLNVINLCGCIHTSYGMKCSTNRVLKHYVKVCNDLTHHFDRKIQVIVNCYCFKYRSTLKCLSVVSRL